MDCTISQFVDTTFSASQEVHNGRNSLKLVIWLKLQNYNLYFQSNQITYPENKNLIWYKKIIFDLIIAFLSKSDTAVHWFENFPTIVRHQARSGLQAFRGDFAQR